MPRKDFDRSVRCTQVRAFHLAAEFCGTGGVRRAPVNGFRSGRALRHGQHGENQGTTWMRNPFPSSAKAKEALKTFLVTNHRFERFRKNGLGVEQGLKGNPIAGTPPICGNLAI